MIRSASQSEIQTFSFKDAEVISAVIISMSTDI